MFAALSPYEDKLLKAALAPRETAVHAWNSLAYQLPPEAWTGSQRRMLPAIWQNLKNAPAEALVYRENLSQSYRSSWAGNLRLRDETLQLVRGLEEAGIPNLVLKGLWMNLEIHRDLGIRPAGDIDLLVRFEHSTRTLEWLKQKGWESCGPSYEPLQRLYHATDLSKDGIRLDLHWFLLWESRRPGTDDVFWAKQKKLSVGEESISGLEPNHLLFHLLVLAEREPHQRVRYLYDILTLWERQREKLSLPSVIALLQERKLVYRSIAILEELCSQIQLEAPPFSNFDQLWCRSTQAIYDGSHEYYYGLFPLLDYYLHYFQNDDEPGWGLGEYLKHRLGVEGAGDFLIRIAKKGLRLLSGGKLG